MSALKKITVSVSGEQYHLITDERETDVQAAAHMVSDMMRGLRDLPSAQGIEDRHLATLTALRLALQNVLHNATTNASTAKLLQMSENLERFASCLTDDVP